VTGRSLGAATLFWAAVKTRAMALLPALKNPSRRTRFAGKGVVGV